MKWKLWKLPEGASRFRTIKQNKLRGKMDDKSQFTQSVSSFPVSLMIIFSPLAQTSGTLLSQNAAQPLYVRLSLVCRNKEHFSFWRHKKKKKNWVASRSDPTARAWNNTFGEVRQTHLRFPTYELSFLCLQSTSVQCEELKKRLCRVGNEKKKQQKRTLMFPLSGSFPLNISDFIPLLFFIHMAAFVRRNCPSGVGPQSWHSIRSKSSVSRNV